MVFVACGLNHKTAPLVMREKFACPPDALQEMLHRLLESSTASEAAVLSTCNRTEFYCDLEDPAALLPWLSDEYQICTSELSPYLYIHKEQHALRHILRVACGLDSMMLGEPQILGQMKKAYQLACEAGTVKQQLGHRFQYAFSASKRIRSQSGIGRNPVSVAYAAVRLISQTFPDFHDLNVFLIGSGETSSLVAKYLQKEGVRHFLVASRTEENARRLANSFSGRTLSIADIPQYLPEADVVISATACPLPFINKGLVVDALNKRRQKPMFFLDLAVPRDIEASVNEIEQVQLYNVDDLQSIIAHGMDERRLAAEEAETLINAELDNYIRCQRSLRANDIISAYRSKMQKLAKMELERGLHKLALGQNAGQVLQEVSERLVNKLTHTASVGLRQTAWDNRDDLLDLVRYLFESDKSRDSKIILEQDKHEEIS